jgi:hypothetical protein
MGEAKRAYPLDWPVGWRRTQEGVRKTGRFSKGERKYSSDGQRSWSSHRPVTVSDSVGRILESLEKMGASRDDVVISSNVRTRLDGLPRANEKEPDDPGAAVYWRKDYKAAMRCMAIDIYENVADNLAAIAATLEAMRAIERHGGAEILERTFTGFAALPEKASEPWRDVLGITEQKVSPSQVDTMAKNLMKRYHPDVGGDRNKFEAVVAARKQALEELATQ